jgi:hypothetical protein
MEKKTANSTEEFKKYFLSLYLNPNKLPMIECHRMAVKKYGYLMSFSSAKYLISKLQKSNPKLIRSRG